MSRTRAIAFGLALLLVAGCGAGGVVPAERHAGTDRVLFVSDVHLDPFTVARLAPALFTAPASAWPALIAALPVQREAGYETDTNAALLATSIRAMRAAVPDPRLVVVAGDFLAHDFHRLYVRSGGPPGTAAYDRFVDATIAYLALVFDRAFPHARFLVTIGNNDGYCGDYRSTPHSPFLRAMARSWGPLVDRGGVAPDFRRSFPIGGWYDAPLPWRGLRVLVANSVFWSSYYGNLCGDRRERIGDEQTRALAARLRAGPGGGDWWFLTHIPPGIDTAASLRLLGLRSFYAPRWRRALSGLHTRDGRAFALGVMGHTHMNDYRLVADAGGRGVMPAMLVPSITRFAGNDPAFLVGDVDAGGRVRDVTAYHDSATVLGLGPRAWSREYVLHHDVGLDAFDTASLTELQRRLAASERLRDRFYGEWYASGSLLGVVVRSTWHRIWCSQVFLTPDAYLRCRGKE